MARLSAGIAQVICGDCIEEMKKLEENSVDAIICDPPYGIAFMGKDWDKFTGLEFFRFSKEWCKETFRVLKLGGYLLAFCSTRRYHWLAAGVEMAGFKVKDMLSWMYGSGFPKSYDISKGIDAFYGKLEEREVVGKGNAGLGKNKPAHDGGFKEDYNLTLPITPEALQWDGWGTALKPAFEPIVLAQKPYEKTYAENVLKYGVGGLNIDACRINYSPTQETDNRITTPEKNFTIGKHHENTSYVKYAPDGNNMPMYNSNKGRFPSNVLLTHHPECKLIGSKEVGSGKLTLNKDINRTKTNPNIRLLANYTKEQRGIANRGVEKIESWSCHPSCPIRLLDEQSGNQPTSARPNLMNKDYKTNGFMEKPGGQFNVIYNDKGGASRFFYSGKAHKSERNAGLEELEGGYLFDKDYLDNTTKGRVMQRDHMYCGKCGGDFGTKEGGGRKKKCTCEEPELKWKVDPQETKNNIPTLKPINLMRYLVRLITPPNGIVLDPFAGSGTTGIACIIENFNYILIEKDERFANVIIPKRLEFWSNPNNWSILKDHNELPKIKDLQLKKKYKKLNKIKIIPQNTLGEWIGK